MISQLKGTIESIQKDRLVIMTTGGVGYELHFRIQNLVSRVGDEVSLYTYLKVSEQAMELYGFGTLEEKDFFELLITVSGVGPKAAMKVLSLGSILEIKSAISRADVQYLTAVQGMGKKTAERLCVELKNKVVIGKEEMISGEKNSEILSEVIDGLVAMGYSKEEAKSVTMALSTEDKDTEILLREALRGLNR